MKAVNNDRGYVLVMALLVIVLIGLLVPPLVSSVLSSAVQADRSEETRQLARMTDMGKLFARETVLEKIDEIGPYFEAHEEIEHPDRNDVIAFLEDGLSDFELESLDFTDYEGRVQGDFISIAAGDGENEINIRYEIEAFLPVTDGRTKTVRETFTIRGEGGGDDPVDPGEPGDDPGDFVDWDDRDNEDIFEPSDGSYTGGGSSPVYNFYKSARFHDQLRLSSSGTINVAGDALIENGAYFNNDGALYVEGSLLSEYSTIRLNQGSKIIVNKNLILVETDLDFVSEQRDSHLCVRGDLYLSYDVAHHAPEIQSVSSCDSGEINDIGLYVVGNVYDYSEYGIPGESGSSGGSWIPVGTSD